MSDVQRLLEDLKDRGWTWASIADEMGVGQNAVSRWYAGRRYPANVAGVMALLAGLKRRTRIPKRKRYSER